MLHRYDRLWAMAIALSINGMLFWFLQSNLGRPEDIGRRNQSPIEIVWVTQTSEAAQMEPAIAGKPDSSVKAASRSRKPATAGLAIAASTTSELDGKASAPLDLALPEAPVSFQRNPLEHRKVLAETPQNRMDMAFQDRSVGGVMQRMTKSSICRELRAFLTSAQGDADVIVSTMKEHGCRI